MVSGKKAMRRSVSFFIFSGGAARAVFMFQGGQSAERMKTILSGGRPPALYIKN